jgi:Uma2 family endonuclease
MEQITNLSQLDIANGLYSYADYLTWKFDQTVELLRGKIFPMAGPSRRHQGISWNLTLKIGNLFKNHRCRAYAAPFDVRLYDRTKSEKANKDIYTVVQPDICVICDLEKLDDKGCIGSPDLIIEILSPGNSSKEMKAKKQLYEECGVREYLIFDPEREAVFQFHLTDDNVYSPATIYVSEETVTSVIFPELQMDLTEVFQAD